MLVGLFPICVLVLQGQKYFLKVCVILIAYKSLEHFVTLLHTDSTPDLRIGQLVKEVVSYYANQSIVGSEMENRFISNQIKLRMLLFSFNPSSF